MLSDLIGFVASGDHDVTAVNRARSPSQTSAGFSDGSSVPGIGVMLAGLALGQREDRSVGHGTLRDPFDACDDRALSAGRESCGGSDRATACISRAAL